MHVKLWIMSKPSWHASCSLLQGKENGARAIPPMKICSNRSSPSLWARKVWPLQKSGGGTHTRWFHSEKTNALRSAGFAQPAHGARDKKDHPGKSRFRYLNFTPLSTSAFSPGRAVSRTARNISGLSPRRAPGTSRHGDAA